jgi:hypothetical protein
MKNGVSHGFGRVIYANGSVYIGMWKDDEFDGRGIEIINEGDT